MKRFKCRGEVGYNFNILQELQKIEDALCEEEKKMPLRSTNFRAKFSDENCPGDNFATTINNIH